MSADLTLSAHWRADPSAKVFTVSFDPGNGQMVSGRSVRAGQAISEPKAPTRSGYVFDGWYTTKSGGSKYDFSTPVTADLNLYAHWTAVAPKTFTVSFDTAGGSKVASQKVRDGAKASRPADPTCSGYSFDGWYKGGSKYDFSTPVTADMTLTAHWKAAPVRTAAMHRLYNPYTGEHFYTADTTERDHLTGLGWRYEASAGRRPPSRPLRCTACTTGMCAAETTITRPARRSATIWSPWAGRTRRRLVLRRREGRALVPAVQSVRAHRHAQLHGQRVGERPSARRRLAWRGRRLVRRRGLRSPEDGHASPYGRLASRMSRQGRIMKNTDTERVPCSRLPDM